MKTVEEIIKYLELELAVAHELYDEVKGVDPRKAERRNDPRGVPCYWGSSGTRAHLPLLQSLPLTSTLPSVSMGTSLLDQRQPVPSSLKTSLVFYGKIT